MKQKGNPVQTAAETDFGAATHQLRNTSSDFYCCLLSLMGNFNISALLVPTRYVLT